MMKTFIKKQPPGRLIAMGFAMVILIGTCLLLTPWSVRQGVTVKPVDALFSATSAVCVTGLVTIDTADHFTAFGQAIMGLLIQIGGLGVSSVGVGLVIAAGKEGQLQESYYGQGSIECRQLQRCGEAGESGALYDAWI